VTIRLTLSAPSTAAIGRLKEPTITPYFCISGKRTGLNHFSYEVRDIDDVMMGHEYLRAMAKYKHICGIGRHHLGSQVGDYGCDPWGRVHEHWTASDRVNAHHVPILTKGGEGTHGP